MVHKIAICDDEVKTCSELEDLLYECGKRLGMDLEIDIWYSGEKLCDYLRSQNAVDLLFLDIELVKMDGVAVGKYIREELQNWECTIVYISSKSSYAMSLFRVQPLDFLLKPLVLSRVEDVMERYLGNAERRNGLFEYGVRGSSYKLPYKNIVYFYSDNKKIHIVTEGDEAEFNGKLKELASRVPHNFIMIHQSYLINLDYVRACHYETVEMQDGTVLSISQPYRKMVREHMMQNKWRG